MNVVWELQKSIYSKLSDSVTGLANVDKIYHTVPENEDFPYVSMEESNAEIIRESGNLLTQINFCISVFFREKSNKNILLTVEEIKSILESESFQVSGYDILVNELISCKTKYEEGKDFWRSNLVFKFVLKSL